MPIYEYHCEDCEHELEVMQKITEDRLTDCPACGKATLVKKISAPSFRLKGGGWYETDFKTGNKKNLAGEGGEKAGDKAADKSGDKAADKAGGDGGKAASAPKKSESKESGSGSSAGTSSSG